MEEGARDRDEQNEREQGGRSAEHPPQGAVRRAQHLQDAVLRRSIREDDEKERDDECGERERSRSVGAVAMAREQKDA